MLEDEIERPRRGWRLARWRTPRRLRRRSPCYRLPQQDEADDLLALSEVRANEAEAANQRSHNYVLAVVLFASSLSLFFAGIATKFASERVKVALVALGAIAFLGTATWTATFPVTVGL